MARKDKSNLSSAKAQKILKDASVRGKALTKKQKAFFGAIAGGQKPKKRRVIPIASQRG